MGKIRNGKRAPHTCGNCGVLQGLRHGESCPYANTERIVRLEEKGVCPFWMPLPNPNSEFIRKIQQKFEKIDAKGMPV